MKNTKKLLIFFSAIVVLVATVFSVVISAVVAGEGTSIDEYTSKKVTAYYSFEDGKRVELVRGSGGIFGTSNSRPAANYIYSNDFSLNYFGIDYYNNIGENLHCYAEPTVGSLDNVEETPANGYVAEFDIAFFSKVTYADSVSVTYKDAEGKDKTINTKPLEYLYVHKLDEDGNYALDGNGKYLFKQEVDENGLPKTEPVYKQQTDADGNPLYAPAFNSEGGLIGALPVYTDEVIGEAPVYVKQLDADNQPILVQKTTQGDFDGLKGSFAVQMQNDKDTQNRGAVNLFYFETNKSARTATMKIDGTNLADIPTEDKVHVFGADQWLHVTIQYDAQAMLTHIYVGKDDSVYHSATGETIVGRRLVGTKETQGINHELGGISVPIYPLTFRLGSSSTQGEVGLDNFVGYQGTTVHNPTYITSLTAYKRFIHIGETLGDESVVATDRYQSYLFIKSDADMQGVLAGTSYGVDANGNPVAFADIPQEDKDAIQSIRSTYSTFSQDEMNTSSNGVYDALLEAVKLRNVELYKEYVDLAVAEPRLIDNVETRSFRVTLAETFVANTGSLIDTSNPIFKTCNDQLRAIKATLAGDSDAYEFVRLMTIFNNSAAYGASLSRLQTHFDNASAYVETMTDCEVFAGISGSEDSYEALSNAVSSYESAASVMAGKTREVNSVRFVSIIDIIREKTSGSWATDGEEVRDLWYRAYQIIVSGEYDVAHTGFETAKAVFDLAHEYFWNELQNEHIELLTAKLDSYNEAGKLYIDKAGICTYVERYFEINAIDIDFESEEIKSIIARNEAYKLQLSTHVGDYKNLLTQNTTKFINIMDRAAQFSSYKDLKPLFDEATSYYYTMNIEGEGIETRVEQYDALAAKMKAIEADSEMFVAVVNGERGYDALETASNRVELYRSLTACYSCLENLDTTYEGVAAAKAIYDAEYAEYTNSVNLLNTQIDQASDVAFSVRGNWDIDNIVAFVKNLIDTVKE